MIKQLCCQWRVWLGGLSYSPHGELGWYDWRVVDGGLSSLPKWACIYSFVFHVILKWAYGPYHLQ
ncbi:hypothetical protein F383_19479 [Gossypium arboreum]|uniref:Uncharacterized protein n=1 Tax=Gossypium arboreum TaxID=29729 RepID=A0A0B0NLR5_GOSAR|nr:hypothetical protein F383_19479 [Gossypium arboreum]